MFLSMSISTADFPNSPQPTESTTGAYATRSFDTDDPVQRAMAGLTELAAKGGGASGTEPARGAGRIEGSIALYGLMEEGEMRTPEELRERMKESGDGLLEQLAEDAEWIAELDAAGPGGKQNGVVSRDAVGNYLQSVYQRVENILDGDLTVGDYDDLKSLQAQDAATGQGVLGELSDSQREDLSHRIAADPALLREWDDIALQASADDYEAALEQARDLVPSGDSDLQGDVAGILYGSLTERNYQDLKDLFANEPEVGAKVLETIAPLQGELAERLGGDKRVRWEREDQPDGFKALLSASLGASRKLLVNPEEAEQLSERLEEQREEAEGVYETFLDIAVTPDQYEQDMGLPPGTVQPFVEEAQVHADQLDELCAELFTADMELLEAADTNAANLDEYFNSALGASAALSSYMEEHAQPFMQSLNDAEFVALNQPGTPEQTNEPEPASSECPPQGEADSGSCSAQDEAGPSGIGAHHVQWAPESGNTQEFYFDNQAELESELTGNAEFIAYANEYLPGWDMVGFAAFCARLLLMGKQLPK
jgi:hypothetical protein